jgi:hypothetical protein
VCSELLELVHMDLCGPLPVPSLGGSVYFLKFLDGFSRFSVVRPIKLKSDTSAVVREVLTAMEVQTGHRLRMVRTDNGREYINRHLSTRFKSKGVLGQTSVRYTPQQNGAAERLNRTLLEKVRAMLAGSGQPKELWAEAVVTASHIRNRSPVAGKAVTPWELFLGSKPNVSDFRTWGSVAYAQVPTQLRSKLEPQTICGVMVGYHASSKGYRILLPSGQVTTSRDVVFDESPGGGAHTPAGQPGGGVSAQPREIEESDSDDDLGEGEQQPQLQQASPAQIQALQQSIQQQLMQQAAGQQVGTQAGQPPVGAQAGQPRRNPDRVRNPPARFAGLV